MQKTQMYRHPVWAVAAAILIHRSNAPMHLEDITEDVYSSDLTILGMRGGNLRQSVGPQLTHYHSDKFRPCGNAFYALANPDQVRRLPKVQRALAALDRLAN